ncbi:efflux RND transporter periplasmic adaptor subunit [Algoriphagus sp. CAU 1675]|uniref:efflux RND transporter periplasmic adaptor subunit n=1 Tax=Algoriphagus sp. CAU 1675 TaxID=3032597 RepID=UPI0023DAE159|nr:efflux RND transporter periplasmic adaptor subunit [Algoriphagus sp. CAU 1675]MDF2157214.1 efflux RND transporter periplasmic adaptor subunit [Algoriphagus sp. CAU 1675]
MKKILIYIIPLALIAIVAVRLVLNKKAAEERVYVYDKDQAVPVFAVKVTEGHLDNRRSFSGVIEPIREGKISAEVQGKVTSIAVEVGQRVGANQLLVQQDVALLQLQLKAAEVQKGGLEADLKRYRVLVENEAIQGIQLEKTELALAGLEVQIATLKEQLAKSSIKAPFSGIVTAKMTEVGDFAAPGKPLIQVTDLSRVKLTIQVPENDLGFFQNGSAQLVKIASLSTEFPARVSLVGSRGSVGNNFPVELTFENTANLSVKAGMFGEVLVKGEANSEGVILPASALVGSDLDPKVYVIQEGKAKLQSIAIAQRIGDHLILKSGVKSGDLVITGGLVNVFEGANVEPNFSSER